MKITRIEIDHFGKLNNFSLDFSEGLNFIYGHNEDGKSTILAFLRMMFYGNVGQSRELAANARKKYRPWNGSAMGGVVEFEAAGKNYRLEKHFGQTAGRDEVSLYDLDAGADVALNAGEEIGQSFFGVDLGGFERSVFISRSGGFEDESDKNQGITEKLINLSTSADEKVSLKRAEKELQTAAEKLVSKRGNTGLLVAERARLAEIDRQIHNSRSRELSQRAVREQYETLVTLQKAEKRRLESVRDQRSRVQSVRDELEEKKQNKILAEKNVELFEAEKIKHAEIAELNIKQAEERISSASAEPVEEPVKEETGRIPIYAILAGAALAAAIILAAVFKPVYAFVAVLSPVLILLELNARGISKKGSDIKEEAATKLARLENELEQLLEQTGREAEADEKKLEALKNEAVLAAEAIKHCEAKLATISRVVVSDNNLEDEIIEREQQISELKTALTEPESPYGALEDQRAEVAAKVDEYEKQYAAIKLALEVMESSAEELRKNFGPKLNDRTAEIFTGLTGGRYKNVNVSKDFGIKVLEDGDTFYREGGYLSNGTQDQAYFALRLSIADLLAEETGERLPLFLDDVFEQYDDTRTTDGLVFLKTYANEQNGQVIFFSCHNSVINEAKTLAPAAFFGKLG